MPSYSCHLPSAPGITVLSFEVGFQELCEALENEACGEGNLWLHVVTSSSHAGVLLRKESIIVASSGLKVLRSGLGWFSSGLRASAVELPVPPRDQRSGICPKTKLTCFFLPRFC